MTKLFARAIALLCIILPGVAFTQDLDSLLNMSAFTAESDLQKALNQNTTVSSSKALTTRETPSIISLITAEEIQNSGARDLTDVLRLVPGFEIAQDLQFVLGIGLRGSWANEGKVLVMMDGQPFNELLYQGVAIGNRFPVDAIDRIEIIRGPGSAIYGGSAEYGVINIIKKVVDKLNGVSVYGTGGFHSNATGRTNAGVMFAKRFEKSSFDFSVFKGKGIVSDGLYTELYDDTVNVDLKNASNADPLNINAGIRTGNLTVRTMYEQFKTSEPFSYVHFTNFFGDIKYDFNVNDRITITPQFRYTNQLPFQYGYFGEEEDFFKARAVRYYGSLTANIDVSRKTNVNIGAVYFKDEATDLLNEGYFNGSNTIGFDNIAFFAQGLFKHRLANATVGFRYERNNQYGDAFVPRVALTKKIENLHFKILYSQAFRAPSIENINLSENQSIKPEKSRVFEVEFGYQFTSEMLLSINGFSLNTKNVIIYDAELNGAGAYENFDKSGSSGVELVYSIRKKGWYSNFTYSFSQAGKNTVDSYAVPGDSKQFVGLPIHKLTLNTNFNLSDRLTLNPTFIFGGKRYAYTTYTSEIVDGEEVKTANITALDPYLLANVFLNYRNIVPGLTAGLGVFDFLNQKPSLPQAYNGNFAPIPGRSREYVIKLSYNLNFK